MTDNQMMNLAEHLALRACISALARTVLTTQGSEAFVTTEEEALRFIRMAADGEGEFGQLVAERGEKVVGDIFAMGDA